MEGNWQATEVGLQVNLGRETATRAAKRLIMLPPFAPAAETWARTTVESNICTKCAVSRHRRQGIEERFESSRSAQPPEPLPHAVPAPEFLRKSPPSNIMNHKIVQGFEKLSVVPALVAAPRPRCREHPQYNRPILFRHGREHGRSSKNRLPKSQRKSDLGIPLPYTWLNPSTRPSSQVLDDQFHQITQLHLGLSIHGMGPFRASHMILNFGSARLVRTRWSRKSCIECLKFLRCERE